ncbi:MAG: transporter substrate-binding domain-containing protein [Reinekea sp.]|nr:transporter substrate-binding domain-containing protein [Reinekea sp.]
MFRRPVFILLLMVCLDVSLLSAQTKPTIIVTSREDAVPYIFLNHDRKVDGVIAEITVAIAETAEYPYQFYLFPWARAYQTALTESNVFIPSLFRNAERETLFKWVGDILPMQYHFFRVRTRSDLKINTIEQAKSWRIGVIKQEVADELLTGLQFQSLTRVEKVEQLLAMLLTDRIDLALTEDIYTQQAIEKDRRWQNQFRKAMENPVITQNISMAFSKDTDDAIVTDFKNAFEAIQLNGRYQSILDNWKTGTMPPDQP